MTHPESKVCKVLVATDFSEPAGAALGRALWLADNVGAEVTVAHVVEDAAGAVPATSFEAHWSVPPAEVQKAERKLRCQSEERLTAWVAPQRGPNRKLRTETLVGSPFIEIIHAVQRGGYDLVVAGTRGLSGFHRFLVGSTAERLVRKCPCPVWIVKPGHEWPMRSILVPVDYSVVSGKSLRLAALLARLADCPLTVLHSFNFSAEKPGPLPTSVGLDISGQRREVRKIAAKQLDNFLTKHLAAGTKVQPRLGIGTPWRMINALARRIDTSLIVMGSVGRSGLPGMLIGNTAEKVLRSCDRSLLTVKPDDFLSPVQPSR